MSLLGDIAVQLWYRARTHVLNVATVPGGVSGQSGGRSRSPHDGGYGALAGKAVALEPSTGFSFDSPMTYKPR